MTAGPGTSADLAVERCRQALARSPEEARLHEELGIALFEAGRLPEAANAFFQALRRDRSRALSHLGLAWIFDRRGDVAVAEGAFREVLKLDPDNAAANSRLGQILTMTRVEEAEPPLRRALAANPDDLVAARHLAYVLRRLNRVTEAKAVAQAILALRPDDLQASLMTNLALAPVPESAAAVREAREGFASGLERLEAGVERFARDREQVLGLKWENFLLAYQGADDRPLQERYGRFLSALLGRAAPELVVPRPRRIVGPRERLRVGFLSSFLYDCTVGKYFRSWITGLDRERFEVFAYHTGYARDGLTEGIGRAGVQLRHVFEPAVSVAGKVLADRLDVLVFPDVGMETTTNLIAAMRLAAVQCAAWGHPVTTGLPSIQYYLSCGEMEPEGADAHYSERLVRLPGIGVHYDRPVIPGDATRERFGLPLSGRLYLCPQSAFKIHPDNDALFAGVLAADPEGRLVFFNDFDRPLTGCLRARLDAALAARGVDKERVVFLERVGHEDYLRVNTLCDVMLDTLHWSGGNTSLDAIAAGLPMVTLPGPLMRGRQSLGMLRILDLEELVAKDAADYVRLAVRLASDRPWRADVVRRMAEASGRLFGQAAPVTALAQFLEGLGRP